jgi:hypothetical protein
MRLYCVKIAATRPRLYKIMRKGELRICKYNALTEKAGRSSIYYYIFAGLKKRNKKKYVVAACEGRTRRKAFKNTASIKEPIAATNIKKSTNSL